MEVTYTIDEARGWLTDQKQAGFTNGFVPTMGALHEGHLTLVKRAVSENTLSTCSIFVNPIQFNNPDDLAKYPRSLVDDLRMLKEAGCQMVFVPSAEEMYPEPVKEKYDFGFLERVMEGFHRPGHFNGVAVVVNKLFNIIRPDRAYLGEKDFQQLKIIQALVRQENIPVRIIPCPTVREPDGLAMSSRNRRLSAEERALAPLLYLTLTAVQNQAGKKAIPELKQWATDRLVQAGFVADYFEIASAETLQPVLNWDKKVPLRAFVACFLGNVRLIDNMELIF